KQWQKVKTEANPVLAHKQEDERKEAGSVANHPNYRAVFNPETGEVEVRCSEEPHKPRRRNRNNKNWSRANPEPEGHPAPVLKEEDDEKDDGSSSEESGPRRDETYCETTLPAVIPPIEDHEREAIQVIRDTEIRIAHEWTEWHRLSKTLRKPRSHYECVESAMYRRVRIWDESEDKHEDRTFIDDHLRIYGWAKEGKEKERAIRVARWLLNDSHKTSAIQRCSYSYDVVDGKVVIP
ncbi:hypothetical protein PMAYCL1PPCAC_32204, partial [Pristionchus mayeri]